MSNKRNKPEIKNINKTDAISQNNINHIGYPVFCFKYLQPASIKDSSDADFFVNFLFRLQCLSDLGWKEIGIATRHGFGTENIPIDQIKPQIRPSIITPEVKYLTAFRANGDNRPFLGIRNRSLFHVIYIETKFGDIYNHNL